MTQIESRSARRGIGNLLDPGLEHRPRVVRPRPGLRMELHRPRPQLRQIEALDGAVVERDVRRLARPGRCNGEAVVLTRDEDTTCRPLEDGMVGAAVAE